MADQNTEPTPGAAPGAHSEESPTHTESTVKYDQGGDYQTPPGHDSDSSNLGQAYIDDQTPEQTLQTPATDSETQARIESLKAQRSLNIERSLGDLTPADRNMIKGIDTELASINPTPETKPSYLGTAPGWDSETVTPAVSNEAAAPEPTSSTLNNPEPVMAAAPKTGFLDKLKGLFIGRKTQHSGI